MADRPQRMAARRMNWFHDHLQVMNWARPISRGTMQASLLSQGAGKDSGKLAVGQNNRVGTHAARFLGGLNQNGNL
jgi:hypothetical protein